MAPTIRRKKSHALEQFNFIVAGTSRLGKSAFLRTFLHTLHIVPGSMTKEASPMSTMPSSTNSQPSTDSQSQQVSSSLRPSTSASTATTSTTATSPPTSPVKETHTNSRSSSVSSSSSSSSSSDSPPPPLHLLPPGPTTSIRPVNLIVQEGDDRFSLTLVDTPGFIDDGTVEEQCRLLLTYLENQFDARLIEESRVRRSTRAIHTQMHACLYFLDPAHVGLRPVDILAIRHLSLRVNVIPILAMADTLTSSKLRRVKRAIRRDIISHSLQLYPFPALEEDEEDRDGEDGEAGVVVDSSRVLRGLLPFSIISMEEEEDSSPHLATHSQKGVNEEEDDQEAFSKALDAWYEYSDDDEEEGEEKGEEKDKEEGNPQETQDSTTEIKVIIPKEKPQDPVNPLGRTYPWGRVNVLEPLHCDFSALRTSLLLSHRTLLREVTIDVLYEKYRTERMRERRATMIAARQSKLLG